MNGRDRWNRIQQLFHESLERYGAERDEFLAEACGDDLELRGEVEALLHHHTPTGDLFDAPRALADELMRRATDAPVEGRSIGGYRLRHELGSGGMGRVFLAEREDLPKRVALKLLREPLAAPDRVERFRREQQVLARLEHPGIAQLLDAGVTPDGSPWLAMEYVDGETIVEYCDRTECGVEDRIRLVLGVCGAVRYAHTNLVVHRDLKPSNIMVTRERQTKLLDFGVAKLLGEVADPALTRTGTRVFTPAYAAPEQLSGGHVSTATDVYQLGGLLYELLTGRAPLDLTRCTPAEAERVVRERDPDPLSAIAPEGVRRRLRGDLENIVRKALAKEPERRYASVEALAADLERFLDGRAVTAAPGTLLYRTRKLLLRHKAAAGVALLILGYAITATVSATSISRQRVRAERAAVTATRVSDFLIDAFTRADPADTVPGDATALDLVNRGAARVEQELADEPEIQAAMQEVLGRVYHGLGEYGRAEPLLRTALATRLDAFGPGSAEVASAQHHLAQVLWANGDLDGADTLNQQAFDVRRRLFDESDSRLWETLGNLGTVRQFQGRLDEAEAMVAEVVQMVERAHPEGHPALGGYLSNLANIHHARGDYAAALDMMQEALESDRAYLPSEHPDIALRLDNLAYMALRAERYEEAIAMAEEALDMYRRVYGRPHHDMPYAMATVADAALALGDTARADSTHLAALDMRRSLVGPDHQDLYRSYRDVGAHLMATGRAGDAEAYFEEALRIARLTRGESHEWYGAALWNLGRVRERLDDLERAEALMRQGLALHVTVLGGDHPVVADERAYLAEFLRRAGRAAEADSIASFAGDSITASSAPGDPPG